MNDKLKESTIPKEIIDAIILAKKENLPKSHSSTVIYPKTFMLYSNEDQENDEMKDSDSNKEYKIGNYMV